MRSYRKFGRMMRKRSNGAGVWTARIAFTVALLALPWSGVRAQAPAAPVASPTAVAPVAIGGTLPPTAVATAVPTPVVTPTPTPTPTPTRVPTPAPTPTPTHTPIVYPEPRGALDAALRNVVTQVGPVDGAALEGSLLTELYGPRAWAPLWVGEKDIRARVASVTRTLGAARAEGLDPTWYHVKQIEHLAGASGDEQRAQLDVLLSDAVMHYAAHVRDGAFRPDKRTGEVYVKPSELDPTQIALDAAHASDPGAYLASFVPTSPIYVRLREELGRYRDMESGKGLPAIADGPKLANGSKGPRVRALRGRLEATGDLTTTAGGDPEIFDDQAQAALEGFQKRHGLPADGVVTSKTRSALNGSGAARVRQLEIALEKFRWLPEDLGSRHVFVNIPEQRLHLRDGGRSEIDMPVVVGKPTWQTPEFSSEMVEIVFNPPWNVPPKIAREEVLPRIHSDGSYLARHDMRIRGRGRSVPLIQQAPGPRNPLGRAKFNFPNSFDVYLHDTPNKGPFRAVDRRLSHGCVRVADAKGLAATILSRDSGGGAARQKSALATYQTRTVALGDKLPVHIVYFTAWPNDEGEIVYRGDVYGRDARLAARWNRPRNVRKPPPVAPPPVKSADEEDLSVSVVAPGAAASATSAAPASTVAGRVGGPASHIAPGSEPALRPAPAAVGVALPAPDQGAAPGSEATGGGSGLAPGKHSAAEDLAP